jgi:uncharacterized protein (TIGR00251 family)
MSFDVKDDGQGVIFDVQVVPRASRERIGPVVGDRLKVQLTAPPVDGAANDALRAALARALGVARGTVRILRGETGRKKTVRIDGVGRAAVLALAEGI